MPFQHLYFGRVTIVTIAPFMHNKSKSSGIAVISLLFSFIHAFAVKNALRKSKDTKHLVVISIDIGNE